MTDDIVEHDRRALSDMLDAALRRAGAKPQAMVDFGLPRALGDAEVLERAGARFWSADRHYLARCWGPVDVKAKQVAGHPEGESMSVPPPALIASSRLP